MWGELADGDAQEENGEQEANNEAEEEEGDGEDEDGNWGSYRQVAAEDDGDVDTKKQETD